MKTRIILGAAIAAVCTSRLARKVADIVSTSELRAGIRNVLHHAGSSATLAHKRPVSVWQP